MLSKKIKFFIYIILFLLIFNLILPCYIYAIDEDSVYVWSDSSSFISTSNTASAETENENNINQESSR